MLRMSLAACIAVLAMPAAGYAQNGPVFQGSFFAGYSAGELAGVDLTAGQIGLESDIIFNPSFQLGFDVDVVMGKASGFGTSVDVDITRVGVEPRFNFGQGFYVGAYYQMSQIDVGIAPIPITFGVDYNSYGALGGYDNGTWNVEAYIGKSDTDPSLPAGVDITDYGITGGYHFSPEFQVYGTYARTDIDLGGASVNVDLIALGGEYDLQNGVGIFGSVGRASISTPGPDADATNVSLGVSYDLSAVGSNIPAVLSLAVSHTSYDASALGFKDDNTAIKVGVTIPIGGGSKLAHNSASRLARGDVRSAVAGGLMGIF